MAVFINRTTYSDALVRDVLKFCRQKLGIRDSYMTSYRFTQGTNTRGRAWGTQRRILVVLGRWRGKIGDYKYHFRHGFVAHDPLEAFVYITAHEMAHIAQWKYDWLDKRERRATQTGRVLTEEYMARLKPRG